VRCAACWRPLLRVAPGKGNTATRSLSLIPISRRVRQSDKSEVAFVRKQRIVEVSYVFFETPIFSRSLPSYLDDREYGALQIALLREPERGDVMPGTGGFRKLRWADRRRHKGRGSGLRVIYYVLSADRQIWLFAIYDKDELEDLTATQCRLLRSAIHEELRARKGRA
jgi:hypothetical protein